MASIQNTVIERISRALSADNLSAKLLNPTVISVFVVLIGWQFISTFFSGADFPGLGRLAENLYSVAMGTDRFQPEDHIPITFARIVIGFILAMVVGITVGIVMGINKSAERYLITSILSLLAVPAVIWAFLSVSWFGLTRFLVPVVVIFLIVVPYVTINIWEGTKDVDYGLVEMANAFDASTSQIWFDLYIPHLAPYIFSTFRIAFAISWKISLIAEIFGTSSGVGFIVGFYFTSLRADMVIAWALPVMFIVFIIDRLLKRVEDRSFEWRSEFDIDTAGAM